VRVFYAYDITVEILFFAGERIDFLIYPVIYCICCGLLVLQLLAIDFDVDVVWFQVFNFAHIIKPHCSIYF